MLGWSLTKRRRTQKEACNDREGFKGFQEERERSEKCKYCAKGMCHVSILIQMVGAMEEELSTGRQNNHTHVRTVIFNEWAGLSCSNEGGVVILL